MAYERERLMAAGKDSFADRIEHVSVDQGDGAGFDICSFDLSGSDMFIEVKTTRFRKESPFFITANEVEFSRTHAPNYALYRVYRFTRTPRIFSLTGQVSRHCRLTATQFRASFE